MSSLDSPNVGSEVEAGLQDTLSARSRSASSKPPSSSSSGGISDPTKTASAKKTAMSSTVKIRKTVMVIEPPDPKAPGENLLIVARFDGASGITRSVVFIAVDFLERSEGFIRGFLRGAENPTLVTEFPTGTPYMMLRRELVRFVSPLDLARYEQALDATMRAEFGTEDPHAGHPHMTMTPEQAAALVNQKGGELPTGMYL